MENTNQANETKEAQQPAANLGAGGQPSTTSIADRADAAAQRLENANRQASEILRQQQDLYARQRMGGSSIAGQVIPQVSEADHKKKSAVDFWKGTGIDKAIEKYG